MPTVKFEKLLKAVVGKTVERPNNTCNGTLSSHAAGEPFERCVFALLKQEFPEKIYKQHEFLHDLFLINPKHISVEDKYALIESPTAYFLLSWDDTLFEERQNDTADILFFQKGFYNIIDVKTRNLDKHAQPPNIISAYKLAQMCGYMIENQEYDTIGIDYIGIDWREDKGNEQLVCEDAQHVNLFRVTPSELYINWAAGLQIQFHPHSVDQTWADGQELWARAYLRHFVSSAQRRCDTMREKFIEPFLKYID